MKNFVLSAAIRLKRNILALLQIAAAYIIVYVVFKPGAAIKIDRSGIQGIKPPFIVLGNHTSNFDPALVQYAIPYPCYFLTSNYYFRLPVIGRLLRLFEAIPKIQFSPDMRSARKTVEVISRGGVVGIFPEGRRSVDGSCCPIPESVAKLIKKLKVPVVAVKTNGGYFVWPRWSPDWRRGRVETVAVQLLSAEDIAGMSTREIYDTVCRALTYNDYEWNRNAREIYPHNDAAENLHLILHQCPRCHGESVMGSSRNKLLCNRCGNGAIVDVYGFLLPINKKSVIFNNPVEWNAWQRQNMLVCLQDENYQIRVRVRDLQVADKYSGAYRSCGYGEMTVNQEGLHFYGMIDGQAAELSFSCEMLPSISTEFKDDFEICDTTNAWWFFLAEEQQTVRIEAAISLLYEQQQARSRAEWQVPSDVRQETMLAVAQ
ncbi:lysophospholipid acyltransferase family protein [Acetonema longum]|uniref:Phospholipid/glycerol acyltransferase n=1 Tax=Acetonema longum DSM 6540 TaxID=1009370 RepID=F7NGV4_9FIRM|nr:lysophospholipid acyltransferase family protein [Acetonema longum]EGO64685.1 phospholipid/glycerol acyltransferase [Acetonema longum DSM 6540]